MSKPELSENVKRFIFEFVDSVEFLDVLLMLNSDPRKSWNAETLSRELSTNPTSTERRLITLKNLGLAEERFSTASEYNYVSQGHEWDQVVKDLAVLNTTKRHQILQLIFSPLKQARVISDGFRLPSKKTGKEE